MEHPELIPHLFRTEFHRIVAVLCRHYGYEYVDEAEDIASSTFLAALETWPYQGIPPSPVGWLHAVAKNKAINNLKRKELFERKIGPGWFRQRIGEHKEGYFDLSEHSIRDSQVRMIFTVCDPVLTPEVQVAMALRTLCGFSVDEIASAFLSTTEAISKRIQRGKERLRNGPGLVDDIHPSLIDQRSPAVMATLYLLFNEGYHASGGVESIRHDLCEEAMRMMQMLLDGPWASLAEAKALFALMCFQSSRLNARVSSGDPVLFEEQDAASWDASLITQGAWWMKESASGEKLSKYHLEAMIAWSHLRPDAEEGKWMNILDLYDRLLAMEYNPVVARNRIYALAMAKDKMVALEEAAQLGTEGDAFHHSLMAWLLEGSDTVQSRAHLMSALAKARNPIDLMRLRRRLGDTNS